MLIFQASVCIFVKQISLKCLSLLVGVNLAFWQHTSCYLDFVIAIATLRNLAVFAQQPVTKNKKTIIKKFSRKHTGATY